jgi:hypothetical protein
MKGRIGLTITGEMYRNYSDVQSLIGEAFEKEKEIIMDGSVLIAKELDKVFF